MNQTEQITGVCEMCGCIVQPEDLYVDLFNSIWSLECEICFHQRNNGRVKEYFNRIKEVIPDIMTESKFDKLKKANIIISNAFVYIKNSGNFTVEEREHLINLSADRFTRSKKVQEKFKVINVAGKVHEQINEGGVKMLVVAIRAKVKFKSYLGFLEHELYMKFRKDNRSIFEGGVH